MDKYKEMVIKLAERLLQKDEEISQLTLELKTPKQAEYTIQNEDGVDVLESNPLRVQRFINDIRKALKNQQAELDKAEKRAKLGYKIKYNAERVTVPSKVQEYIHECEIKMGELEAEKAELNANLEEVKNERDNYKFKPPYPFKVRGAIEENPQKVQEHIWECEKRIIELEAKNKDLIDKLYPTNVTESIE